MAKHSSGGSFGSGPACAPAGAGTSPQPSLAGRAAPASNQRVKRGPFAAHPPHFRLLPSLSKCLSGYLGHPKPWNEHSQLALGRQVSASLREQSSPQARAACPRGTFPPMSDRTKVG